MFLFSAAFLLTVCSNNCRPHPLTGSGFAGDHGAVRILRKDTNDEVLLSAVLSPLHSVCPTTNEYLWQGDTPSLIELNIYIKPPEHLPARFARHGQLSLLHRDARGQNRPHPLHRTALSPDRAPLLRPTIDPL
ncbi:DUF1481 domain-containing protein, partial [Salmonella enterica]|uniref:DUF1481 domain-containing protein n=1 Tax=Salmonella enterica TaxID=28901 RepID=UPI0012445574